MPSGTPIPASPSRVFRAGKALDVMLCVVLFDGDGSETMSHYAARRRAEGAGWACLFCRLLALLVERNHCAKALAPGDVSRVASVRAGLAMLLALAAADWLGRELAHAILRVL